MPVSEKCSHGADWKVPCMQCELVSLREYVARWEPEVQKAKARIAELSAAQPAADAREKCTCAASHCSNECDGSCKSSAEPAPADRRESEAVEREYYEWRFKADRQGVALSEEERDALARLQDEAGYVAKDKYRNVLVTDLRFILAAFSRASSSLAEVERDSSVVCITAKELLDVFELAAPDAIPADIDRDHEQMDTEMCIGRLKGSLDDDGKDTGPGLFAWYSEYPEEGVIPLRLDRDTRAAIAATLAAAEAHNGEKS